MTYEELLAKVEFNQGYQMGLEGYKICSALCAVVELHKPVQSYMFDEEACSHCSSEEDRSEILYPCPTVRAIEGAFI